jgi:hypothetical protein
MSVKMCSRTTRLTFYNASLQHGPEGGLLKCEEHTIFLKFLIDGSCYPNHPFVIPNVDILYHYDLKFSHAS